MLIQFRAENFLSIKGSVVLSLLASKDKEHPKHLIVNGSKRYLKSAGIYGANASGKSNVLHAFWFMVNYVLTSHNQQLHKAIERSPFKFDRETPVRPSSFEVIFTANGIRYAYGFSVTDKVVIEEYLYYYPNGRQAIIFERQNTNDFRFTVDVDEQSMLKNRTSPNKLYLSVASNWSYSKVIPVLEWFASCRIITKHSAADAYELEAEQLKDDGYQRKKYSGFRKCHAEHLYIIQKIRAYPFQQLCQLFADAAIIIKLECPAKRQRPRKQCSCVQTKGLCQKSIVVGEKIIQNSIEKGYHDRHDIVFIKKDNYQNTGERADPHNHSLSYPYLKQFPESHRIPSLDQQNSKIYQRSNRHKTNGKYQ